MKLKKLLCTALSVAMLSTAALAVDPPISPAPPVDGPVATFPASPQPSTVLVYGAIKELGEHSVTLENSNESDPYQKITVNVGADTLILDAVTGASKTFQDLRQNETLYAYVSAAMTRSIPPQSAGHILLCNLPADFAAPTYVELQSVTKNEDGRLTATTDRDVILHFTADTKLVPSLTKNLVTLDDLKPGATVLAWYQVMTLSLPAQASPTKVMIFPSVYSGYLSANETTVNVNGAPLSLSEKELPLSQDGTLLLPLRKVVEALGCTVTWSAEYPDSITVQTNDGTVYMLSPNQNTVTADGDMISDLIAPITIRDGVTFLSMGDLVSLHSLKLVTEQ